MPLKVLIASTTWFAMPARVTLAFLGNGAEVSAIFPKGNPIHKLNGLQKQFRYSQSDPIHSLSKAIEAVLPDFIIPCDDRVVEHLHQLHGKSSASSTHSVCADIIESSLGDPAGFATSRKRGDLLRLAEQEGIRIPATGTVCDLIGLHKWLERHGYPAVLKIDGTWAGSGVRVLRTWAEAERAFVELTSPMSFMMRARCFCTHDYFPLFSQNSVDREELTIQTFIEGKSVNAMYACWQGNVLDHLSVETLYAVHPLGSSTIIKTILNEEMERAGRLIVKELGMTGFCGMDFIIDAKSGFLYLIELNPRITQIGHLEPGGKQNLVTALCRRWAGESSSAQIAFSEEMIAFFPHSLRCKPNHPLLASPNLRHDIPIDEPELVRELSRKPWNSRHLSSRVFSAISRTFYRSQRIDADTLMPVTSGSSERNIHPNLS